MPEIMKYPILHFVVIALGLLCQTAAALEYESIKPARLALMGLATGLMTMGNAKSAASALKKAGPAVMAFLGFGASMLMIVVEPGCAWLQDRTNDAADCAVEAGKEQFTKLLPEVRRVLADPNWTNVQSGMTTLVTQYGRDFVVCMVQRAQSDAMALGSDGSGQNGTVAQNAEKWLAQ